jgi:hypothetical protein
VKAFTVLIVGLWTALSTGIAAARLDERSTDAAIALGVVLASLGALVLARLLRRSCHDLGEALLVRGFWGSYVIPRAKVVAIATTRYSAYYQGYEWAKVIVIFDAADGRHSVVVSANRKNSTTTRQAETISSWLADGQFPVPTLEHDNWRPSRGEMGRFARRLVGHLPMARRV